jgi:hypothetical protein
MARRKEKMVGGVKTPAKSIRPSSTKSSSGSPKKRFRPGTSSIKILNAFHMPLFLGR